MADSINPRCPVHGVRHKRPMCDDTPAERPGGLSPELQAQQDRAIADIEEARRG